MSFILNKLLSIPGNKKIDNLMMIENEEELYKTKQANKRVQIIALLVILLLLMILFVLLN